MESKYGRLLTMNDVHRLVDEICVMSEEERERLSIEEIAEEAIACAERDEPLTFPPDEPLFLLRGQDRAAPSAIQENPSPGRDYWMAAARAGASDEHLAAIAKAAREMREWQAAHPDRVKVPD